MIQQILFGMFDICIFLHEPPLYVFSKHAGSKRSCYKWYMRHGHKIFHGNGHLLLLGASFHIFCTYNLQYHNLYLPLYSALYFSNPKKVTTNVEMIRQRDDEATRNDFQSCDNHVLQILNKKYLAETHLADIRRTFLPHSGSSFAHHTQISIGRTLFDRSLYVKKN